MSDLQCPATVILLSRAASESDAGRRLLAGPHVAGVFIARDIVDAAALRRFLDELSDLHRGETIAVVTEEPVTVEPRGSGWTLLDVRDA